ncbi:MAG: hypothetical protein ACJ71D_00355, partial [Nitrososphaera sp.]
RRHSQTLTNLVRPFYNKIGDEFLSLSLFNSKNKRWSPALSPVQTSFNFLLRDKLLLEENSSTGL